jgi:hypothetical protein
MEGGFAGVVGQPNKLYSVFGKQANSFELKYVMTISV